MPPTEIRRPRSHLRQWPKRALAVLSTTWLLQLVMFGIFEASIRFSPQQADHESEVTALVIGLMSALSAAWLLCDGDRAGRKILDRCLGALVAPVFASIALVAAVLAFFVAFFASMLPLFILPPWLAHPAWLAQPTTIAFMASASVAGGGNAMFLALVCDRSVQSLERYLLAGAVAGIVQLLGLVAYQTGHLGWQRVGDDGPILAQIIFLLVALVPTMLVPVVALALLPGRIADDRLSPAAR